MVNKTTNKYGLLSFSKAVFFAVIALLATNAWALPSTGATNLFATGGVSTAVAGNTLNITAPDRAVLTWQNFGSGTDRIAAGELVNFAVPTANSAVLNIVTGVNRTTLEGALSSNGNVYVLNPNGVVISGTGRVDVNSLYISTVDNPFGAALSFQQTGKLPSETGTRYTGSSVSVSGNATISALSGNITIATRDADISGAIVGGSLKINADGNVILGGGNLTYVSGSISVVGNSIVLGVGNSTLAASDISLTSTGNITNSAAATLSTKSLTVNSTADVSLSSIAIPAVTVNGNNVSVGFGAVPNPTFSGDAKGTLSVTSPSSLTLANVTNSGVGNATFSSVARLTLGNVHLTSTGASSFNGASVADSLNNVFVYGATAFTATAGDIAITKAGHSFGPLSIFSTGNAVVFEGAATNLNQVRVAELTLRTGEFFFQTPLTSSLSVTKFNLTAVGDVNFLGGTILGGLTVLTNGNVDLSKLSLSTNLNGVAPIITTKGTVTNPNP